MIYAGYAAKIPCSMVPKGSWFYTQTTHMLAQPKAFFKLPEIWSSEYQVLSNDWIWLVSIKLSAVMHAPLESRHLVSMEWCRTANILVLHTVPSNVILATLVLTWLDMFPLVRLISSCRSPIATWERSMSSWPKVVWRSMAGTFHQVEISNFCRNSCKIPMQFFPIRG